MFPPYFNNGTLIDLGLEDGDRIIIEEIEGSDTASNAMSPGPDYLLQTVNG